MIAIHLATPDDAAIIRVLAETIWWPTYMPIISPGHIRYMLDSIYELDKIEQQIANGEQTYLLLTEDGEPKGFAAYAALPDDESVIKVHKLYCLPEAQGQGYGRMLINAVEQALAEAGKTVMELNVNRNNPAVRFYEKMGFDIVKSEDIEIGKGFILNDYVMRKSIS